MSRLAVAGTAVLVAGCAGVQSAFDPAGPAARRIVTHGWVMIALTALACLAVIAVLVMALARRHDEAPHGDAEHSRRRARAVAIAASATFIMLLVIFLHSLFLERANASHHEADALVIEVRGLQWWWDIRYQANTPAEQVRTANEIHLPVGRLVELHVTTADVIHSLWIPNLHGKKDMLPGRTNVLRLRAERTGVYRGQCAEFCGLQHANMAFAVVVHAPEEFDRWYAGQQRTAQPPRTSSALRGREVFENSTCVVCHRIRGTVANGEIAPDLTHLAGRRTLAAGTLANVRGNLAAWILDPQHIKPGSRMPATDFAPADLHALLDYLMSLE